MVEIQTGASCLLLKGRLVSVGGRRAERRVSDKGQASTLPRDARSWYRYRVMTKVGTSLSLVAWPELATCRRRRRQNAIGHATSIIQKL